MATQFTWFLFRIIRAISVRTYTREQTRSLVAARAARDAHCVLMGPLTMVSSRRPSTGPYPRASRARFPNASSGPMQMTTDTALGVTKRVIVDRDSSSPSLIRNNWLTMPHEDD